MNISGPSNAVKKPLTNEKSAPSFLDSTNLKVFLFVIGVLAIVTALSLWQMGLGGPKNWIALTVGSVGCFFILTVALRTLYMWCQDSYNKKPAAPKATASARPSSKQQAIDFLVTCLEEQKISREQVHGHMLESGINCSSRSSKGVPVIEAAVKTKNLLLVQDCLDHFSAEVEDLSKAIKLAIALEIHMEDKCQILESLTDLMVHKGSTYDPTIAIQLLIQTIKTPNIEEFYEVFDHYPLNASDFKNVSDQIKTMNPPNENFKTALKEKIDEAYQSHISRDTYPEDILGFVDLFEYDLQATSEKCISEGAINVLTHIITKRAVSKENLLRYANEQSSPNQAIIKLLQPAS